MKRLAIIVSSVVLVLAAGALTFGVLRLLEPDANSEAATQESSTPALKAETVATALEHPWDIDFLSGRTMIFTERSGDISKLTDGKKAVLESVEDVDANGESGLMGLAVDPDFASNNFIYACFSSTRGDVRVARWLVDPALTGLTSRTDIVTGMPLSDSGRHSGCQLAFGPDGNLWIGTGDATDETQPQDQDSLGGKILRVTRDGAAAEGNPNGPDKRVFSYGHRNVQGLAFYRSEQAGSFGVSVEHGSDKDDEVNELKPGNFGWDPGDGYDESVAMTDTVKFPNAIPSVWSSGSPTIAPSGAAFLYGNSWGRLEGWLAVSVLKDQKLLLLNIKAGSVNGERTVLDGEYGRLRAATIGPDGRLYITTDNGQDDKIIVVSAS